MFHMMSVNAPGSHQFLRQGAELIRKGGGGQNVSCDFGEGGETYHKVPPPKPVLEASDLRSVPVPSKENDIA